MFALLVFLHGKLLHFLLTLFFASGIKTEKNIV